MIHDRFRENTADSWDILRLAATFGNDLLTCCIPRVSTWQDERAGLADVIDVPDVIKRCREHGSSVSLKCWAEITDFFLNIFDMLTREHDPQMS